MDFCTSRFRTDAFSAFFTHVEIKLHIFLEYLASPKDNIKEAIDVLSLLSGQEGGIKPRVLTHRGKYSDEGASEVPSEASNDRPDR